MSDPEKQLAKTKPKSLFVQDLDRVSALIKRSASLGAVIGFVQHLTHFTRSLHC